MSNTITRFECHIDIPEIGLKGQDKLMQSSVLIVGLGGLGCPAALYLTAAGIGTIGLADDDTVSLSNLQRQVLYTEADVGKKKTEMAEQRLRQTSTLTKINVHPFRVTEENISDLIGPYELVLDCSDNFQTRFLINKHCHLQKKKLVSASLYHHDGQISVFKSFEGAEHPCYECVFPTATQQDVIPSCGQSGVIGPVAGILGTMQASAAINEILNIGDTLSGSMLMFNALSFETQKIRLRKRKDCVTCAYP